MTQTNKSLENKLQYLQEENKKLRKVLAKYQKLMADRLPIGEPEIIDRKLSENELKFQLDFKELIATQSSRFNNLHWSKIGLVLDESLSIVGEFLGLNKAMITSIENEKIRITEFWSKANPKNWMKMRDSYEKMQLSEIYWLVDNVKENGYFLLEDLNKKNDLDDNYYNNLKKAKVKSLLILPMFIGGKPIAFLSLVNTRKNKVWNPDTIALLRILTQVFSNALERRTAKNMMNYRMKLENIITHISSGFINLSSDKINDEIIKSLQRVGEFLQLEQAFVLLRDNEGNSFSFSHYWSSIKESGVNHPYLENIPAKNHIWEFKQLRDKQVLVVNDSEFLPSEASDLKATMDLLGIGSLLVVPISFVDKFYGALGFFSNFKNYKWNEEIISLLKILGQVFANAIERKKAEDSLIEQEEIYKTLAKNIPRSTVFLFNHNLQFRLAEGSGFGLNNLNEKSIRGKYLNEVFDKNLSNSLQPYFQDALNDKESTFEKKIGSSYYIMHFLPVRNQNGKIYLGMLVAIDITNLKEIQQELEIQAEDLKRSNEDLEQFAYAASHDLQEPLRMVSSYVHLIKRRLGDALKGDINEFMDFAIEGASRMQELIYDLLEYSRVDRSGKDFEAVDMNEVLKIQETMLQNTIKTSGTTLKYENMPVVKGDKSQLNSLFQNLIENAIKFKGESSPVIEVGYKEYKNRYNFWVKDNGIGIDERFFKRIFVIFQRLNNRTSYSGTGIGLAICKKIVERHGGKIWVKSVANEGSTFYFDIKK